MTLQKQNKVVRTVILVGILLTLIPFMTPRPQLASYALFAYYLYAIKQYLATQQPKQLYPLPILMVLWVNLHGGYLIGVVLLSITAVTFWLEQRNTQQDSDRKPSTNHLALIAVATFLASALNPDFIDHWAYPFYVLSMEATTKISEWHSPNFHTPYGKSFLAFLAMYIAFLAYSRKRPPLNQFVVPVFFIATALMSTRNIPFALISIAAFTPRLSDIDTTKLNFVSRPFHKLRNSYVRLTSKSADIGDKEYLFNWILIVLIAVIVPFLPKLPSPITYPEKAVDYFLEQKLEGNILSEYQNGGYLIHRLYPAGRVFIDGRADMYGDEMVSEHGKIMHGSAEWNEAFDRYDIDYVICSNDSPIRQLLLLKDEVKVLYEDNTHSILANNPQPANDR